jgi:hypothetical protein
LSNRYYELDEQGRKRFAYSQPNSWT